MKYNYFNITGERGERERGVCSDFNIQEFENKTQQQISAGEFLWRDRNLCEDLEIFQSLSISGFSFPFVC